MKNLNRKGFTMVELLIVLAIIAILAAVAIPVYSSQLEASRKKVDESNLRAATGLAAQAILLADPGVAPNGLIWEDRRYLVFTYEDAVATGGAQNEKAAAKNMLVFRDGGTVTRDGNWYEGYESHNSKVPANMKNQIAFTTVPFSFTTNEKSNWSSGGSGSELLVAKNDQGGNGQINNRKVVPFPLQQNKGNARFSIVVSRKGAVVESKILTDKKISVNW